MMRYLFFLRHYNDIDNIAPAIHYLLADDPQVVADVILYHEDYTGVGDPNLAMLVSTHGGRCTVRHIGDLYGLSPTGPTTLRWAAKWVRNVIDIAGRVSPAHSRALRSLYRKLGRFVRSARRGTR